MTPPATSAVVLLGAQRFDPTLGTSVKELGVTGRIALITAGWQEREPEDEELVADLGVPTVNLRLHARGEMVFRDDPELREAHRQRQAALRYRQDVYRIRLEHLLEADRVISLREAPPDVAEEQAQASLASIRDLDAWHLELCAKLRSEYEARWDLPSRPVLARHREEITEAVAVCDAVAISGGHVATLVNRLVLFGIGPLLRGKTVFAWSGGAMALSDRVVLFHDSPPQGPGASEVLDAGLGVVPNVVVLPEPERRLRIDDRDRVQRLARRFAPASCLAFPARSRVTLRDGVLGNGHGVKLLKTDGAVVPFHGRRTR